nr:immunoglobulin light chain junction region [Macaca mulatta]MPO05764.1 immunoglobulin light chain junction region [Macaca mulatta]MPO05809.1 immunoglobulin light chain junction region [Macaca mulatta]MPO06774.1 immunoglobulin light chain junction region [Macaca mulatta]MPO07201.1 immunoglobulin light chain junction region [Macaca mulatta]
CSSDAGSNVLF